MLITTSVVHNAARVLLEKIYFYRVSAHGVENINHLSIFLVWYLSSYLSSVLKGERDHSFFTLIQTSYMFVLKICQGEWHT